MKTFLEHVLKMRFHRSAAAPSPANGASPKDTSQKIPNSTVESVRCGRSATQPRSGCWPNALLIATGAIALLAQVSVASGAGEKWEQQLRADWIVQEHFRNDTNNVAAERDDAAGGCDGIKNGKTGFHTGKAKNPWWEVELGAREVISKIVIWNRKDQAERASKLVVRLSDGPIRKKVYHHDGSRFGGISDGKPLVIHLTNEVARVVRIQLPSEQYLHLDEVEVFGPADPTKNLALNKPANQVSVSLWSVSHRKPPHEN